jgi:cellulose synthase/poly-beta-1,6-N-acetylglucosamine synthase-like glycosyltransferase/HEAT repeat protein
MTAFFEQYGMDIFWIRRLSSPSPFRRKEAATYLPLIPTDSSKKALIWALETERSEPVRLMIINALVEMRISAAIPNIIDTLSSSTQFYQKRIGRLLSSWSDALGNYFFALSDRQESEIQFLFIELARISPRFHYMEYLQKLIDTAQHDVRRKAFKVLGKIYPDKVDPKAYLNDRDPEIRKLAVELIGKRPGADKLELLLPFLGDEDLHKHTVSALESLMSDSPGMVNSLLERFIGAEKPAVRNGLLQVLSTRSEYFLGRLAQRDDPRIVPLIEALYEQERMTGVIGFLNANHTPEISDRIISVLKPVLRRNKASGYELRRYLNRYDLEKLSLSPLEKYTNRRKETADQNKLSLLVPVLAAALIAVPGLYLLIHRSIPDPETYVLFFNYTFGFYMLALNAGYLLILSLSYIGIIQQKREWEIKGRAFLFKPGMLPSISIIAPAFNEELSIVESINALLSLEYPLFEVIVVNDGSADNTLERAIAFFELERTYRSPHGTLETGKVRGVYHNPEYPNLTVIDKVNGGKADSLNAGINFASGEYFAGIDSDSLIEPDSLLKLTAPFLDEKNEVAATGGNIFPINGCSVHRGSIREKRIPRNMLARVQTIEYIRAFMAGRVGWSKLRALLIISGAFGLFSRKRVIEVHGYLTGREVFQKDTVGEDMELVVRLRRSLMDRKIPFSILYQHNSSCWTEVPERWKVFTRQRDRWQRGLIDIIHFHRKMIFRRRYGTGGMVAFPYYILFEIFGPLLEVQGYAALFAAILLGTLDTTVLLFLFSASVLFGFLISLISLGLSELGGNQFPPGDKIMLLFTSLAENLGIRQYISLMRVGGFVSSLKRIGSWGSMERRGFYTGQKGDGRHEH